MKKYLTLLAALLLLLGTSAYSDDNDSNDGNYISAVMLNHATDMRINGGTDGTEGFTCSQGFYEFILNTKTMTAEMNAYIKINEKETGNIHLQNLAVSRTESGFVLRQSTSTTTTGSFSPVAGFVAEIDMNADKSAANKTKLYYELDQVWQVQATLSEFSFAGQSHAITDASGQVTTATGVTYNITINGDTRLATVEINNPGFPGLAPTQLIYSGIQVTPTIEGYELSGEGLKPATSSSVADQRYELTEFHATLGFYDSFHANYTIDGLGQVSL